MSQYDKCPRRHDFSRIDARGQGHSDATIVRDTLGPKVYPHIKFGIPTSNNIGDILRTRIRLGRTHGRQFKNYMPPKPILGA